MIVYELGQKLIPAEVPEAPTDKEMVFITQSKYAQELFEKIGMEYEGEVQMQNSGFCKIETQQECLVGTLYVPRLLDVLGPKYGMMLFINKKHIVIVDNDGFAERIVSRIVRRSSMQGETREKFIYNFFIEFMKRDLEMLGMYEKRLMEIEEKITDGNTKDFYKHMMPIRRELLTLRSYYDEIMDLGRELEEDENDLFDENQLKFFGTFSDRADRLMNKTSQLLEYAQQIRDAYQYQTDAEQNNTMKYLTVVSTVFFPLTLVTGWYGMNFQNMPELKSGYPMVIVLSIIIVAVVLIIFKIKKII